MFGINVCSNSCTQSINKEPAHNSNFQSAPPRPRVSNVELMRGRPPILSMPRQPYKGCPPQLLELHIVTTYNARQGAVGWRSGERTFRLPAKHTST